MGLSEGAIRDEGARNVECKWDYTDKGGGGVIGNQGLFLRP